MECNDHLPVPIMRKKQVGAGKLIQLSSVASNRDEYVQIKFIFPGEISFETSSPYLYKADILFDVELRGL